MKKTLPGTDNPLPLAYIFIRCVNPDEVVDRAEGVIRVRDYIRRRVLEVAHYIYETRATVRQAARVFGVSKSTVHKDVTERLLEIDSRLGLEVKKVLDFNKAERHLRGGEATRRKYLVEGKGSS